MSNENRYTPFVWSGAQRTIGLLIVLMLLAACSNTSAEMTLAANYAQSSTQISELRETATVQTARLRTTLDYSETRVALVATQSQFLKSTLAARGTPIEELNAFQRQMMGDMASISTSTPPVNGGLAGVAPTPAGVIPPVSAELPTASPDPSAPRLENVFIAADVGADDCGTNPTTEFNLSTEIIYLSARAMNITPGTTFVASWTRPDGEVLSYDWVPDFAIDDACIWLYLDQTDQPFIAGSWQVQVEINGTTTTDSLPFTIQPPADAPVG